MTLDFMLQQIDYLYFLEGLIFLLFGATCWSIRKISPARISWELLSILGIVYGMGEWLDLAQLLFAESTLIEWADLGLRFTALVLLLELSRKSFYDYANKKLDVVLYCLLFLAALVVALLENRTAARFGLSLLGFMAGLGAAMGIIRESAIQQIGRLELRIAAVLLGLLAAAIGVTSLYGFEFFEALILKGDNQSIHYAGLLVFHAALTLLLIKTLSAYRKKVLAAIPFLPKILFKPLHTLVFALLFLMILLFGWIATEMSGEHMKDEFRAGLIRLANIISCEITPDKILKLAGSIQDKTNPDYIALRKKLDDYQYANSDTKSVFLLGMRDGQFFFYSDSGDASENPAEPGEVYEDADEEFFRSFATGEMIAIGPYTDKWGSFITASLPILDASSGKAIALLGIDVDARHEMRMIALYRLSIIAMTGLAALFFLLYFAYVTTSRLSAGAIAQSTETLLNAEKIARIGSWKLDVESLAAVWSEELYNMLGLSPEGPIGYHVYLEMAHPEDRPKIGYAIENLIAGEEISIQHRLIKKNDEEIHVRFQGKPTEWKNGRVSMIIGIIQDITDQVMVNRKLEKETRNLQMLLDNLPGLVFFKDAQMRFVVVNRHFASLFGKDPSEMVGLSDYDLFDRELAKKFRHDDGQILSGAIPCLEVEEELVYNSEKRIMATHKLPQLDEEGRIIGLVGLAFDVTLRKRAEEDLEKTRETISAMTRVAPNAIIMLNEEGNITFWNQTAERIFGYKQAEVIGHCLHQLIVPERYLEPFRRGFMIFRQTGSGPLFGRKHELYARRKNGEVFPVEVCIAPLCMDGKWNAVGVMEDISERKIAEQKLEQALVDIEKANANLKESASQAQQLAVKAEAANVAKSQFLANMSHEIRTPLNGVIGMTGLLIDMDVNPIQREYLEIIRTSGDSLLTLINDILDFSKIEADRLDLEALDFDLRTMMEDLTSQMAIRAHEKGLDIGWYIDPETPVFIQGDPGRLRQVLVNLVGNSIKFTHKGEVHVRISLDSETEDEVKLRFMVRDTGIGIPEDKISNLFTPFMQVDASTTRKYGGTGLGLSISKRLIQMMGGEIQVSSQVDVGATFTFTGVFAKQKNIAPPPVEHYVDIHGLKILVVDDNETNRFVLGEQLKTWNCQPVGVETAVEAYAALKQASAAGAPFRVAILDMQMPGDDGEALGIRIKQDPELCGTILILMTSLARRGDARLMEQIGFAAYLIKPVKQSLLLDCLRSALLEPVKEHRESSPKIITRHSLAELKARKIRILVVEDNSINQKVAVTLINRLGYFADAVSDGQESIRVLENTPYDIVFMDVQMPVMDGYEATRNIRKVDSAVLNRKIPIIAMTANALKGDRELCIQAGMNDYISKPIQRNEVLEMILKWTAAEDGQSSS